VFASRRAKKIPLMKNILIDPDKPKKRQSMDLISGN